MTNRTRRHPIQIYLSDDEYAVFREHYKQSSKRSMSAYLRQLILFNMSYEVNYDELHEMNYQLSKIGTNINQIAHRVNATGSFYRNDIKAIKEAQEQIWQLQKSILSEQPLEKQSITSVTPTKRKKKS